MCISETQVVNTFFPMVYLLLVSLYQTSQGKEQNGKWIGLKNYIEFALLYQSVPFI